MAPEELLIKISEILKNLEVTYAITGGYAVSVWGRPRYTADIDIIVELEEKNITPLGSSCRHWFVIFLRLLDDVPLAKISKSFLSLI